MTHSPTDGRALAQWMRFPDLLTANESWAGGGACAVKGGADNCFSSQLPATIHFTHMLNGTTLKKGEWHRPGAVQSHLNNFERVEKVYIPYRNLSIAFSAATSVNLAH